MRSNAFKHELDETTGCEKNKRNNLKYEANKCAYDSWQFKTVRSFGGFSISVKITRSKVDEDQRNLLKNTVEYNNKSRPRTKEGKI